MVVRKNRTNNKLIEFPHSLCGKGKKENQILYSKQASSAVRADISLLIIH